MHQVNMVVSNFHFCSLIFPQDLRKYSPQENEVGVCFIAEVVLWLVNVLFSLLAVVAQSPSCFLSCSTIEDSSPSTPTTYWLAWTVKVPISPLPILLLNFTLPVLHLWMRHSQPYSLVIRTRVYFSYSLIPRLSPQGTSLIPRLSPQGTRRGESLVTAFIDCNNMQTPLASRTHTCQLWLCVTQGLHQYLNNLTFNLTRKVGFSPPHVILQAMRTRDMRVWMEANGEQTLDVLY